MEHTTIVYQKFDSNGREIFHKSIKTTNDTTKLVFWSAEYDSNGNKPYYQDTHTWWKAKYDSNGNQTSYEDYNGWWVRKFDSNGNVIEFSNSNGYSWCREFDNDGNITFFRSNNHNDFHFDNRTPKKKQSFLSKLFA